MKKTKQTSNQEKKTRLKILNSLSEDVGVTDNDSKFLFTNPLTNKIPGIRPIDIIPTEQENLTESKLKEIELIKSEEQLKAIFKGFPIPSYLWQYVEDDFGNVPLEEIQKTALKDRPVVRVHRHGAGD